MAQGLGVTIQGLGLRVRIGLTRRNASDPEEVESPPDLISDSQN